MKKSVQLKQQRTAVLRAQQAIVDKAKAENRDFTAEEQAELDAKDIEVEDFDKQIETAEKNEAREDRFAAITARSVGQGFHGGDLGESSEQREVNNIQKRFSFTKAVREAAAGKLEGVEKEVNDMALQEAASLKLDFKSTDRSFSIPSYMMRATTQSVTGDAGAFGGALVPTDIRMVNDFVPKLFLEELGANFLTGLTGNVKFPINKSFELDWLEENEEVTLKASEFDGPTLKPKRAAAGVMISNQLMLQSSVDVEALIISNFRNAAKRAIERAAINGNGIKQPLGLLNIPGINLSAVTAAKAPEYSDILELKGLVKDADSTDISLGFLSDNVLASVLEGVKKDAGSGRFLLEDGKLAGMKHVASSLVPELAGNHPLIYGDWSQMTVGQWGGANFTVDPYTKAGAGAVIVYINLYANVIVSLPKAFAVNKFLTA